MERQYLDHLTSYANLLARTNGGLPWLAASGEIVNVQADPAFALAARCGARTMKLITYSTGAGAAPTLGVTDGTRVASLAAILPDGARDMTSLIEQWSALAPRLCGELMFDQPLHDVVLHAPIARPGKIFGIGLNYADHAAEIGIEPPREQMWFSKPATGVTGPYDPVQLPFVSDALDYEAELVVVIGKRCRHIPVEKALEAVFGYCVGNDVSVRDWQTKTTQVTLGKSFDTHAPFGPWILTADAIEPGNLNIASFVNGELRQHSNTRHLIFDVSAQIAHLSQAMTLEPGDLIFTGTPGGVAAGMKPPRWLKIGDVVRIEIEGIGSIENRVVAEPLIGDHK